MKMGCGSTAGWRPAFVGDCTFILPSVKHRPGQLCGLVKPRDAREVAGGQLGASREYSSVALIKATRCWSACFQALDTFSCAKIRKPSPREVSSRLGLPRNHLENGGVTALVPRCTAESRGAPAGRGSAQSLARRQFLGGSGLAFEPVQAQITLTQTHMDNTQTHTDIHAQTPLNTEACLHTHTNTQAPPQHTQTSHTNVYTQIHTHRHAETRIHSHTQRRAHTTPPRHTDVGTERHMSTQESPKHRGHTHTSVHILTHTDTLTRCH